jgi:3-hydroxyisobutyryl-CoA hydrolase
MDTPEILFERKGGLGLVTLNRPQALNALNEAMCLAHAAKLGEWEKDAGITAVAVRGAGDKAFCAGGDVVSLYRSGLAWKGGDKTALDWRRFFHAEYRMNAAVQAFTKPYISFWDGVVMGGGVGISIHGSHRIATEKTVFAMPETGIGMIPDVGGSWFLPRMAGDAGMYLALTGDRLKAPEVCGLKLATGFMPSAAIPTAIEALAAKPGDVDRVLSAFFKVPGESRLTPHLGSIAKIFAGASVEDILAALGTEGGEWAETWRTRLLTKSPASLKVTFRELREGARLPAFRENMKMEYRIVNRVLGGHDFFEGVRALLIDKDNAPRWKPETLRGVTDADVDAYFQSLGADELTF